MSSSTERFKKKFSSKNDLQDTGRSYWNIINLRAGDQALADGVVVGTDRAELDEALLTGESNLVRKQQGDKIFSGSFCVNGELTYRAEAVGAESFAGKLMAAARMFTQVS